MEHLEEELDKAREEVAIQKWGLEKTVRGMKVLVKEFIQKTKEAEEVRAKDEAILASIGDGIIAVGSDRKIIVMNKVAGKLLGWEIDEAMGKLYDEVVSLENEKGTFVPPEERPLAKAFDKSITITTTTMNLYLLSKNKIKIPVAITVSPIILGNKIIGVVEVFRDITKEQELSRAKDEFLNIAAHDLRTPMSAIRANAEMILGGDYGEIPSKMKIPLEDINKANVHLIKMVNDFLTISRIEKGKITITPQPIDLLPILNSLVEQMKLLIGKTGLKFDYQIPAKLPQVMADSDKIPEVITNLLDNAIKYTDKGSVSLKAWVQKDSVVVAVTDTGKGIAESQKKNLFQKYSQVGTEKRTAYGKGTGLGLGLYISRQIVEGCGGKIWVESIPDKGSTFYFSLPIAKIKKETDI